MNTKPPPRMALLAGAGCLCFQIGTMAAVTITEPFGGSYANWPSSGAWRAIPGINDPIDASVTAKLDFVGDATNPGGYMASDANYVYFRMRVHAATVTSSTYADALAVLIDSNSDGALDYAFAWDSKGSPAASHGLEMMVPGVVGGTWATSNLNDNDGSSGQKNAGDFNNGSRTGDGYVRTTDQQSTTALGTSSYIDLAASWSFLKGTKASGAAGTTLDPNQAWRIQFASLDTSTDHGWISTDVACNHLPTDAGLSFSSAVAVPELPATGLVGAILSGGAALLLRWRRAR